MSQFRRSQRLEQQMLKDISRLLDQELSDKSPGMLTFTSVRLTDDLNFAQVYYSFLGSDADKEWIENYLNRERKRIRSQIGKGLRIRNIPDIEFKFDPSVEHGLHIEKLLQEINSESKTNQPDD